MAVKYKQLASMLRSELQQLRRQHGLRLPTEAELCQKYQMSRQTVRSALKLLEREGLIERRQGSGSYLREPGTGYLQAPEIAILASFPEEYIYPALLHDAKSCLSQAGCSTLVYATENSIARERELLTMLLQKKVSAILIEGSKTAYPTPNSDLFLQLLEENIPVLFFHGGYSNLPQIPCLTYDDYQGGYALAEHLIRRGCRSICGVFQADSCQGARRYHGVVDGLRDHGLPILDNAFLWYTAAELATLPERFLQECPADVSGIVCHNDVAAHFLIKQLLDSGRSVPGDVAVVSFDNSFYSQIGPVTITSLGHRGQHLGAAAAAMLLDMLSGKQPAPGRLTWELVCRSSG